jgi:hypothetical protein
MTMGNAFSAQADAPSALYYNPTGIAFLPGVQVNLGALGILVLQTEFTGTTPLSGNPRQRQQPAGPQELAGRLGLQIRRPTRPHSADRPACPLFLPHFPDPRRDRRPAAPRFRPSQLRHRHRHPQQPGLPRPRPRPRPLSSLLSPLSSLLSPLSPLASGSAEPSEPPRCRFIRSAW